MDPGFFADPYPYFKNPDSSGFFFKKKWDLNDVH